MGVHKNINIHKFPKQDSSIGKTVNVYFNYNTTESIKGIIVRSDIEDPFRTIIKLENNTYIEAVECQYQLIN